MGGQVQRGSQFESSVRFDLKNLTITFGPAFIAHSTVQLPVREKPCLVVETEEFRASLLPLTSSLAGRALVPSASGYEGPAGAIPDRALACSRPPSSPDETSPRCSYSTSPCSTYSQGVTLT